MKTLRVVRGNEVLWMWKFNPEMIRLALKLAERIEGARVEWQEPGTGDWRMGKCLVEKGEYGW